LSGALLSMQRYSQGFAKRNSPQNIAKNVCGMIYEGDSKTVFDDAFMTQLAQSSPDSHTIMEYLISLSKLQGEDFEREKGHFDDVWIIQNNLRNQFHQNLDTLIPLTRRALEKSLTDLFNEWEEKGISDYKMREEAKVRILKALTLVKRGLSDDDCRYMMNEICRRSVSMIETQPSVNTDDFTAISSFLERFFEKSLKKAGERQYRILIVLGY